MIKGKTIFISALDWGLGHATRCVPLIKQLQKDNIIVLGVTPLTSLVFDEEFPDLKKVSVEPYDIKYSDRLSLSLKLLLDAPRIFSVIKKERTQLRKIIHDYSIDVVISDNRFGLYNSRVKSIYITHQMQIQAGLFSGLANKIHHRFMKYFGEIWIPDFENEEACLAGKLSRNKKFKNVFYIGPLSRLAVSESKIKEFDYLCLLSGPEPKRTELETLLMQRAVLSDKKICLLRGTHLVMEDVPPMNVKVIDLPNSKQLSDLITSSSTIVCRSGYSTLMDLYSLRNTNCILIPTPGQSEQVYLAEYWKGKFGAKVLEQENLKTFGF